MTESKLRQFVQYEVLSILKEDKRSELRTAYKKEVFDNTNYKDVNPITIRTALMHLFRFDGGPNDETRQMCIEIGLWWALRYAEIEGPHDDTRNAVLKDTLAAYKYARYVDKGPRDDTRNAVLINPGYSYDYAKNVDKGPRDDTRNAVLHDILLSREYARFIDRGPRDDTRNAVLRDPFSSYEYAKYVDKKPRDDTRKAAWRSKNVGAEYDEYFNITDPPPL